MNGSNWATEQQLAVSRFNGLIRAALSWATILPPLQGYESRLDFDRLLAVLGDEAAAPVCCVPAVASECRSRRLRTAIKSPDLVDGTGAPCFCETNPFRIG